MFENARKEDVARLQAGGCYVFQGQADGQGCVTRKSIIPEVARPPIVFS